MKTPKPYSTSLDDALSLADATLGEGPDTIVQRADFHATDIAQYDPAHPSIAILAHLKRIAWVYQTSLKTLRAKLKGGSQ